MTLTTNDIAGIEADGDGPEEFTLTGSSSYAIFSGDEISPRSPMLTPFPDIPDYATDHEEFMKIWNGLQTRLVFTTDEPNGLNIMHVKIGADYILLPHSHSVNCAYYVTAGEIRLGKRRLGPGAGFYVPAETQYAYVAGPEGAELLEIRDDIHFDMKVAPVSAKRYAAVVANAKAHQFWQDL